MANATKATTKTTTKKSSSKAQPKKSAPKSSAAPAKKALKKKSTTKKVSAKAAPTAAPKIAAKDKTPRKAAAITKQLKTTTKATRSTVKRKTTTHSSASSVSGRMELLRKLLLKKRNEVSEGLDSKMGRLLTRESGQKIDAAMDAADQSVMDVDTGIDFSLLEMKHEQYKDIADAFRKLQGGSYGQCEECGEEIAIKRLEVNPFARYCVTCKSQKEELERIQKEEKRF